MLQMQLVDLLTTAHVAEGDNYHVFLKSLTK